MKLTTQAINKAIKLDEQKLSTLQFGTPEYVKLSNVIETAKYMKRNNLI